MKAAKILEARLLAARLNSPEPLADRWSLSMRLSQIQKEIGMMGVDAATEISESEEENERD